MTYPHWKIHTLCSCFIPLNPSTSTLSHKQTSKHFSVSSALLRGAAPLASQRTLISFPVLSQHGTAVPWPQPRACLVIVLFLGTCRAAGVPHWMCPAGDCSFQLVESINHHGGDVHRLSALKIMGNWSGGRDLGEKPVTKMAWFFRHESYHLLK